MAQVPVRKFLLASRSNRDADFAQTVILVLRGDAKGATGLVINDRTNVPVADIFPKWKLTDNRMLIYKGGPLRFGVNGLVRARHAVRNGSLVFGDVYLISDEAAIETAVKAGVPDPPVRVYIGLCGWNSGQLEDELRRGVWFVAEPAAKVVFDPQPANVWPRLIAALKQ